MHTVDTVALRQAIDGCEITTIGQLSERSGVNRNTLSDVLSGKCYPSSLVMSKLVDSLGMTGEEAGKIFFAKKLA